MSFRYSYQSRGSYLSSRKRRYRDMDRAKGVRKKGKIAFFLLFLALFIITVLSSPVFKNYSSAQGKESAKNIPILLLAYSIPGMGLNEDFHGRHQEKLSGDMTGGKTPSGLSASVESLVDNTAGASFVPVQKPASGVVEDFFIATPQGNIVPVEGNRHRC